METSFAARRQVDSKARSSFDQDVLLSVPSPRADRMLALALLALGACAPPAPSEVPGATPAAAALAPTPAAEPPLVAEATATLVRVIDGDTLEVELDGARVTLRLSSVDTEEKIAGRASASASKPETVFGEETAQWARELFAELGPAARLGLAFPEGRRTDAFGRLLAHVLLPDGRDYNELLVELGKSPYFDKYGNNPRRHAAFAAAEARARAAQRGIWDPATNRAREPGAPSAVRPYERLLPWWDARAAAIEGFRTRVAAGERGLISAEDGPGLAAALGTRATVFGELERFFEERDGSLTVLFRGLDEDAELRAQVPARERAALEHELRASTAEFRPNHWYVSGTLARNARGLVLRDTTRADWRLAEPAEERSAPR
jgi:endonuclease YncB( thermonuclease family)